MAIAYVKRLGSANKNSGSATTFAITTTAGSTGGNALVLGIVFRGNATVTSVVDSAGNVYTVDQQINNGTLLRTAVASSIGALPLPTGGTVTATFSAAQTVAAMALDEFSGLAVVSMPDVNATGTGATTALSVGPTAATTVADELVYALFGVQIDATGGAPTVTATGGATALVAVTSASGTSRVGCYPTYRIVAATGAQTATGTLSVAKTWAGVASTYEMAPATPVAVSDLFTRADSATTLGTAPSGHVWHPLYGTWGIASNQAYCITDADGNIAVVNTGRVDGTFQYTGRGDLTVADYRYPVLVVRLYDANNFLWVYLQDGVVGIQKVDNNVWTWLAAGGAPTPDATDIVVRVVMNGASIQIYTDDVLRVTYTMTGAEQTKYTGAGYTKAGFRLGKGGAPTIAARFDSFSADATPTGPVTGTWNAPLATASAVAPVAAAAGGIAANWPGELASATALVPAAAVVGGIGTVWSADVPTAAAATLAPDRVGEPPPPVLSQTGHRLAGKWGRWGGAQRYRYEVSLDRPQAYWRLGESSGTSAADDTGNGHTGTYVGAMVLAQAGALADGDADTAARFDGVNDQVTAPPTGFDFSAGATVELWCLLDSFNRLPDDRTVVMKSNEILFRIEGGGGNVDRFHARFFASGGYATAVAPTAFPLGQWVHVAQTYDGTTIRLYQNGLEVASGLRTGTITPTGNPVLIGNQGSNGWWAGLIDEVAVYGTCLSPARIKTHYQVAVGPPLPLAGALAPVPVVNVGYDVLAVAATAAALAPVVTVTGAALWACAAPTATGLAPVAQLITFTGVSAQPLPASALATVAAVTAGQRLTAVTPTAAALAPIAGLSGGALVNAAPLAATGLAPVAGVAAGARWTPPVATGTALAPVAAASGGTGVGAAAVLATALAPVAVVNWGQDWVGAAHAASALAPAAVVRAPWTTAGATTGSASVPAAGLTGGAAWDAGAVLPTGLATTPLPFVGAPWYADVWPTAFCYAGPATAAAGARWAASTAAATALAGQAVVRSGASAPAVTASATAQARNATAFGGVRWAASSAVASAVSPALVVHTGAHVVPATAAATALAPVAVVDARSQIVAVPITAWTSAPTAGVLAGSRVVVDTAVATALAPTAVVRYGSSFVAVRLLATAQAFGGGWTTGARIPAAVAGATALSFSAAVRGGAAHAMSTATASALAPVAQLRTAGYLGAATPTAGAHALACRLDAGTRVVLAVAVATARALDAGSGVGSTFLAAGVLATARSFDAAARGAAHATTATATATAGALPAAVRAAATLQAATGLASARAVIVGATAAARWAGGSSPATARSSGGTWTGGAAWTGAAHAMNTAHAPAASSRTGSSWYAPPPAFAGAVAWDATTITGARVDLVAALASAMVVPAALETPVRGLFAAGPIAVDAGAAVGEWFWWGRFVYPPPGTPEIDQIADYDARGAPDLVHAGPESAVHVHTARGPVPSTYAAQARRNTYPAVWRPPP